MPTTLEGSTALVTGTTAGLGGATEPSGTAVTPGLTEGLGAVTTPGGAATADEIAHVVTVLESPAASYINGAVLQARWAIGDPATALCRRARLSIGMRE